MRAALVPKGQTAGRFETPEGQLMLPMGFEAHIPEDDMVRFFARELKGLDYRGLYVAYSSPPYSKGPGRPPTDPRLLFQVCAYAYALDIYSSRKIEEACRKRIDFMWLLNGAPAPDHTTIAIFRSGPCKDAIEDLFYQYVRRLDEIGATDHEVGMIDGTKIESVANRYTFVWRKSAEKNLACLPEKVKAAFERLGIEGEATLATLRHAVRGLRREMAEKKVVCVHGKGCRKTQLQRDLEALDGLLTRWATYEDQLLVMGPDRNSYSKTDPDATFMRMKDDHMRNGQLKPAYNVQFCTNSEFVTGIKVFSERNDVNTLKPFMETLAERHGKDYEATSTDAGYESLENYRFLDGRNIESFIKPVTYEQMKTKKFKGQIGRRENMVYVEEGDYYVCANLERLVFSGEHTFAPKNGVKQTNRVYRCVSCEGCTLRRECCKSKDASTPKEIEVNREFVAYRERSLKNITSSHGIRIRVNRSIQAEGTFGVIKQDHHFRRFLCRGKKKVASELFLLGMGHNIRKHYRKSMDGRLDDHLFRVKKAV